MRLALLDTVLDVTAPQDVLEQLAALFPSSGAAGPGRRLVLRDDRLQVDDEPRGPVLAPAQRLEELLVAINAAAIAGVESFAVHAGVVARGSSAVAWPGVSGAGKSTLTAACLRAGFDYVSDEALVLHDGAVRPYPKPISLSAWSLDAVGLAGLPPGTAERPVAAAELGAATAAAPLAPRHLLVLERRPGPPELRPAEPGAVAMLLLEHSFNHYRFPAVAFAEATAAASAASCWTLAYDAPLAAAELLAARLD